LSELVPILSRNLVALFGSCLLHTPGNILDDGIAAPAQEQHGVFHIARVVVGRNQADTGRTATMNLILQTRPAAIAKCAFVALPEQKQLLQQIDS
jgi:hypothetical protein